MPDGKRGFLKE